MIFCVHKSSRINERPETSKESVVKQNNKGYRSLRLLLHSSHRYKQKRLQEAGQMRTGLRVNAVPLVPRTAPLQQRAPLGGERFSLRSTRGGGLSDKRNCFWSPRDSQPSHSAHSRGREQSELGHLLAEPLLSWAQSAGGALQTRTLLKHTHGNKSRTQRFSLRIISLNR